MATKTGIKMDAKRCKVLKVNSKREASLTILETVKSKNWTASLNLVTKEGWGTADNRKRRAMTGASFRRLASLELRPQISVKRPISFSSRG